MIMEINERTSRNRLLIAIIATHWLLGFIFWTRVMDRSNAAMAMLYGLITTAFYWWYFRRYDLMYYDTKRQVKLFFVSTIVIAGLCSFIMGLPLWRIALNPLSAFVAILSGGALIIMLMIGVFIVKVIPFALLIAFINYHWIQYFKAKTK